ncbi:MAG: DUF4097 family beta strand repeat-containing protein [Bryobacteraceae bacterium]
MNGNVTADVSSTGKVEVTAQRSGRRSNPNDVRIDVVEHAEGVTLCAVYPSNEGANECKPGSAGRMSTRDNDVQVEFQVRVPAGVRFSGSNVNGKITATLPQSEVEARTVNGAIRLTGSQVTAAKTVNGALQLRMEKPFTKALDVETVNGAIVLEVPSQTKAELDARTVNGSIESDLALTVRGNLNRRHVTGTLGGPGGPRLGAKTVNGSIRIRTRTAP